ncbi:MAG: iron uptake transporter deferrochelatase/peroxidase subunit [Acidihalobacter sp.]|uniref:iron uptake transporter deferrochelatase/peroxidase subunit n=1 Tax=Acidihalobacter sp. TaxID=1872108 RepID=UPI00307F37E9
MKTQDTDTPISLQRRRLLQGLGVTGATVAGSLCPFSAHASAGASGATHAPQSDATLQSQSFYGTHQSGVVTPRPAAGIMVAFDVLATDRAGLERLFRTLTERIRVLMQGGAVPQIDPKLPPPDSGILGPVVHPDNLTVTVSVGDSLFDDRFGLASAKPRQLQRMTSFPNDALDTERCHGDLTLQFCANTPDTNIHALRDIIKTLPDLLLVRWKQEGTIPPVPVQPGRPEPSARNFLGFLDGSANPKADDAKLMDGIVWIQPGSEEPAWAAHGSYQVVRIIRNYVERWDRTPLQEQETIFGRRKYDGAPLSGGTDEFTEPDYRNDPEGKITPLDAHIRLANPRMPGTERNLILRRPFNYSNGVQNNGQLDMGLLMIIYQASLVEGFITVQNRLNGEPLEEYIKPIGGGYYFTLPGAAGPDDYLGRTLIQATA